MPGLRAHRPVPPGARWSALLGRKRPAGRRSGPARGQARGAGGARRHRDLHRAAWRTTWARSDGIRASRRIVDLYYNPRDAQLPFVYREVGGAGACTHMSCGYFGFDAKPVQPDPGSACRACSPCAAKGPTASSSGTCFVRALEETRAAARGQRVDPVAAQRVDAPATRCGSYIRPALHAGFHRLAGGPARPAGARRVAVDARLSDAESWTLETLAGEVGMSRSAFAAHFSRFMRTAADAVPVATGACSWPPACWTSPGISIEQVADSVGYGSAAAFNRAFKRQRRSCRPALAATQGVGSARRAMALSDARASRAAHRRLSPRTAARAAIWWRSTSRRGSPAGRRAASWRRRCRRRNRPPSRATRSP